MAKQDRWAESPFQRLWHRLGLGPEPHASADVAGVAETLAARRALLARLAALLIDHDLPITPFTLVMAHDCVTGANPRLAELLIQRIGAGLPVDLAWLEQALRHPAQDLAAEQLVTLLCHVRESLTAFDRSTHGAMQASGDFADSLQAHLGEMAKAGADKALVRSLAEATRAMLAQAGQLHAELAASRKRTAELQSTLEQVQRVADEDHLTGLANRRAFERQFAQALETARATAAPLCLGVVDIDHFKRINDRHGHTAGDRVLKVVAETLGVLREAGCIVGRIGGEEFGVLFPGRSPGQALALLNSARARMAERRLINRTTDVPFGPVTFSGGIADAIACGDLESALTAADGALYAAKGGGRNRVMLTDRAWPVTR
ncbi:GGDEF domain-containing protein [Novosphingobium sp. SG720]|uniref:GGDEF domain-containing protein n=1 Tax=Novosphingobium sp. SG720 TaxID=2586998 RepID=UPI001446E8F5|nr:GGDEF domain-containing protein [Novosphingobium sp. SG720]NKJ44746.1 diguanylate cyclase [Novosphingobium sp. SG720]